MKKWINIFGVIVGFGPKWEMKIVRTNSIVDGRKSIIVRLGYLLLARL